MANQNGLGDISLIARYMSRLFIVALPDTKTFSLRKETRRGVEGLELTSFQENTKITTAEQTLTRKTGTYQKKIYN